MMRLPPVILLPYHGTARAINPRLTTMAYASLMVFQAGALDETLAAAAGNDPALIAELRSAFAESLGHHIDLLRRARCDANWEMAVLRIRGLAASFQVQPLIDLADAALAAAPGEPRVVRNLVAFFADVSAMGDISGD